MGIADYTQDWESWQTRQYHTVFFPGIWENENFNEIFNIKRNFPFRDFSMDFCRIYFWTTVQWRQISSWMKLFQRRTVCIAWLLHALSCAHASQLSNSSLFSPILQLAGILEWARKKSAPIRWHLPMTIGDLLQFRVSSSNFVFHSGFECWS